MYVYPQELGDVTVLIKVPDGNASPRQSCSSPDAAVQEVNECVIAGSKADLSPAALTKLQQRTCF